MKRKITESENMTCTKEKLTATCGDNNGEIDLAWEPVESAYSYVIEKSIGSKKPVKWSQIDIVTKSSYTVSRLKSGHKFWFRIAAVDSNGKKEWSNAVQKKAP